jgi:hypothetical protein
VQSKGRDDSNSRPLECDSFWFAHFDSDSMTRRPGGGKWM